MNNIEIQQTIQFGILAYDMYNMDEMMYMNIKRTDCLSSPMQHVSPCASASLFFF